MPQNIRADLWPYNFIIIQDGKEIYKASGLVQSGASAQKYTFSSAGNTVIKVQDSSNPNSYQQFGTIVYKNPSLSESAVSSIANNNNNAQGSPIQSILNMISPLTLVYLVYAVIIAIPIGAAAFIILIKKGKI
jgi:hypothetical protein